MNNRMYPFLTGRGEDQNIHFEESDPNTFFKSL